MKNLKNIIEKNLVTIIATLIILLGSFGLTFAGSLTPASSPAGTMYTLDNIYTRLVTNATSTEGDHLLSTSTSPASSFHTLEQIYDAIPTIDPTKVLTGTTYLGVDGTATIGGGDSAAPLKTGQTVCYSPSGGGDNTVISCSGTGQDGDLLRGVALSYTNNGDNTVTDDSTGLMWIQDPGAINDGVFGTGLGDPLTMTFAEGLTNCEALSYAGHTDWHLPNIRELLSIADYSTVNPSINPIFTNTQNDYYWSSTSYEYPGYHYLAWLSKFVDGNSYPDLSADKSNSYYVRCVRG